MTVFFTSDTHLNHRLVTAIRLPRKWPSVYPDLTKDQVTDAELASHNAMLSVGWDTVVGKDDVVWVLGDLTIKSSKPGVAETLEWFSQRPGTKHLVPGNHDVVHPMHRDSHKWQKQYLEVFDSVQLAARRNITVNQQALPVLLNHMPYTADRHAKARDLQWRLPDLGDWLLHGHLHGEQRLAGTRQIDVGPDAWDFTPVSLEQIVELMSETA